jgi:hypothetical protein
MALVGRGSFSGRPLTYPRFRRGKPIRRLGTPDAELRCAPMNRFFFDLVGELAAHDVLGHQCRSRKEAKDHAQFIASRVGTERPNFAKPGNYISVRDESGTEIFEASIKSAVHTQGVRRQ